MQKNSLFRRASFTRGVSLLELVIYIGLVGMMVLIISNAFSALMHGKKYAEVRSEVHGQARIAIELIKRDVGAATSVIVPSSILATTSSISLTIGALAVSYSVSDGGLWRTVDGVPERITGASVVVYPLSALRFENYHSVINATTTSLRTTIRVGYNSSSTNAQYFHETQFTASLK